LNASMCLRITSLAFGICSPIVVGSAILSDVRRSPRTKSRVAASDGTGPR
jgi:hypothetical protein